MRSLRPPRTLLGPLAVLALVTAACGGDDDDASREDYVDVLAAATEGGMEEGDRRCMFESFVDAIGVDTLAEEVTPEELEEAGVVDLDALGIEVDEEQRARFYDEVSQCMDVREVLVPGTGDPELDACVDREMDDATLEQLMIATVFSGREGYDPELQERLNHITETCTSSAPTEGERTGEGEGEGG